MALQDALSIFQTNGTDEEKLRENYASLVDQIQKSALSVLLKATGAQISGDPSAGSVKVSRLQTSTVRDYGTARTASEGDKIKDNRVTVNLDTDKEIVEEVNKFDLRMYGLPEMINRRSQNFSLAFARYLDSAFFTEAEAEGTEVDVSDEDTIQEKIEALIVDLETTQNDNVDGVDRSLMALTLKPTQYSALRNYVDTLPNPKNGGVDEKFFHDVRVYSNHRQTEDAIVQVVGSVAQPVSIIDFDFGPIPLSAEQALQLFFKFGTQAVMADLVKYATLTEVSA